MPDHPKILVDPDDASRRYEVWSTEHRPGGGGDVLTVRPLPPPVPSVRTSLDSLRQIVEFRGGSKGYCVVLWPRAEEAIAALIDAVRAEEAAKRG